MHLLPPSHRPFLPPSLLLRPPGSEDDGRFFGGQVIELRIVELEVLAAIVVELSFQQALDDVDRFREAHVPLDDPRPSKTDDVLIEPFTRAKAECEATVCEQAECCCPLCNDSWMVAHTRARYCSHQAKSFCGVGDRAQDGPS